MQNPLLCLDVGGTELKGAVVSEGRVLTPHDEPIPHLYAAGELGSMWGNIYQGATNNAECIVFGRLAGRNAAKEKAWK